MKSCYIHIPFCEKICTYCDFCKMFYNEKMVDRYLEALKLEIDNNYLGEKLETIYIGGGTPSCLNVNQLKRFFEILSCLNKTNNCSITIEGNFESTSYEKLLLYKEYGINRLSFGIESIDNNNLKFLGREFNKEKVDEVFNFCNKLGFVDINIDLMYALPGEDIDTLCKDLEYILSKNVTHISTYSLIIEDHTILGINKVKNINEDLDYEMYEVICNILKKNDYKHYEISNFCKDGFESKHNVVYWKNKEYYGFGLGASGYINNRRYTNTKSINKYLEGIILYDEEILSDNLKIEYEVILNLRLCDGISYADFYKKYGFNVWDKYDYSKLVDDGLLIDNGKNLFIPEDKWYISNEIMVKFLEGV